jgi:1,4-alpha-glucan branching enzyme
MGNEFGQGPEWRSAWETDWWQLSMEPHQGIKNLARDLNRLYRDLPALYDLDFEQGGFSWIDCQDSEQTLLSFIRRGRNGETVIAVFNFTPVPRNAYRIGLPFGCTYRELFNSDSQYYGGSNHGNGCDIHAQATPWMGLPCSAEIELPALSCILLQPV